VQTQIKEAIFQTTSPSEVHKTTSFPRGEFLQSERRRGEELANAI